MDTPPLCSQVLSREAEVSRASPDSVCEFIHADTCPHSRPLTLPLNCIHPTHIKRHCHSTPSCPPFPEEERGSALGGQLVDTVRVSECGMHALLRVGMSMCVHLLQEGPSHLYSVWRCCMAMPASVGPHPVQTLAPCEHCLYATRSLDNHTQPWH